MKTKRVRIAVAMATNGEWASDGTSNRMEKRAVELVSNHISYLTEEPHKVYWVEAEVPVPEVPDEVAIEGEVAP